MAEAPIYDALIVGGGLAGNSLAARLAGWGRRVLVVEKGEYPRDKVCGEFLSPESQGLLEELGVWRRLAAVSPAEISRARFWSPQGRTVEVPLPGLARGLSRLQLDAQLAVYAESRGAELWRRSELLELDATVGTGRYTIARRDARGTRSVETVGAHWVIGAYGRRARLDHELGRPFAAHRSPYLGLKRHHRASPKLAAELTGCVEIHTFDGGYCGMSFVEGDVVNVCMLIEARVLGATDGADWDAVRDLLARQSPSLAARWAALTPISAPLAVAQVPFEPKDRSRGGVLFVGDAAGVIAPFAGDGQAMALESALRLAQLLAEAPRAPTPADRVEMGRRWDRSWRQRYSARLVLAKGLQDQLLSPRRAEWALGVVGAIPGVPALLARLTRSPS